MKNINGSACIKAFTKNTSLSSISIAQIPSKTEYIKNSSSIDLNNGKLCLTYSDGSTYVIDLSNPDVRISGFDTSTEGTKTINVEYKGKQTSFDITVNADPNEQNPSQGGGQQDDPSQGGGQQDDPPQGGGQQDDPPQGGGQQDDPPQGGGQQDDPPQGGGQQDDPQYEPVPCDIRNIKAQITSIEITETDLDHFKMTLEISGIKNPDANTTYKYYYILSGKDNETNITNWVEVPVNKQLKSDGTYSLIFQIDETIADTFPESQKEDKVYLYLKEVASRDGKSVNTYSNVAELTATEEVEERIDQVLKKMIENLKKDEKGKDDSDGDKGIKDDTLKKDPIPQLGSTLIIVTIISLIAIFGVICRYKYLHIDK